MMTEKTYDHFHTTVTRSTQDVLFSQNTELSSAVIAIIRSQNIGCSVPNSGSTLVAVL
jgi:hypothetical protein